MSATVTLTTTLQSLCLFPPQETTKTARGQCANSPSAPSVDTPRTIHTVSSKLVFDTDALCDDSAFVHVSVNSRKHRMRADIRDPMTSPLSLTADRHTLSCSPLIHEQPVLNPFKTMLRVPTTAPVAGSNGDACVHCKRGNFLEFCFAGTRCVCACHAECPCNPCHEIRRARTVSRSLEHTQKAHVKKLDLCRVHVPFDACVRPLATAPISRCMEEK
ncbi:hypothetical protein LPJ62_002549 [Coemansia sp. RSA 2167]|nr:hypothetical protein LPJ58_006183 [Coemansia sp. RSA 1591]KAJ1748064.1 hypothetical protein LPJ69_006178 [Coemansia sp. RSA 1752]KAJ1789160.1 hypothetical protein LPJ62_002549 [Coemansia sp. RSA 2167]KAJ2145916.1 hypothetical protein IW142_002340 [Coemansia sp. RSA 564]KAJ2201419.1 hypothetical protein IW144_000254 [Coemansia sp. RSA 522]KAJ2244506.1 hypothetical protein GGH97_003175 [Coemansia sp. RSA 475]KAJ2293477.1 hypothetical protein IW141_001061 [Coemansia sp. RSA 355]KAJ2404109.1 